MPPYAAQSWSWIPDWTFNRSVFDSVCHVGDLGGCHAPVRVVSASRAPTSGTVAARGRRADERERIYFCDPKSPWQRGRNENTNGSVRQHLPEESNLSQCSQRELDAIARSFNTGPRQIVGWMSQPQAFAEAVALSG